LNYEGINLSKDIKSNKTKNWSTFIDIVGNIVTGGSNNTNMQEFHYILVPL